MANRKSADFPFLNTWGHRFYPGTNETCKVGWIWQKPLPFLVQDLRRSPQCWPIYCLRHLGLGVQLNQLIRFTRSLNCKITNSIPLLINHYMWYMLIYNTLNIVPPRCQQDSLQLFSWLKKETGEKPVRSRRRNTHRSLDNHWGNLGRPSRE